MKIFDIESLKKEAEAAGCAEVKEGTHVYVCSGRQMLVSQSEWPESFHGLDKKFDEKSFYVLTRDAVVELDESITDERLNLYIKEMTDET